MIVTNIVAIAVSIALQVEGATVKTPPTDGGNAVGIGRMHPEAVKEVNRILGLDIYTLADRNNPVKVLEMMTITLEFHHERFPTRDVIWLASKWRNPYSNCPEWHVKKLRKALADFQQ